MVTAKTVAPTTVLVPPWSTALLTSATAAITATIAPAAWLMLLAISSPGLCSRSRRRIRRSASQRRVIQRSYRGQERSRRHVPSGPRENPGGGRRGEPEGPSRGIDFGGEPREE